MDDNRLGAATVKSAEPWQQHLDVPQHMQRGTNTDCIIRLAETKIPTLKANTGSLPTSHEHGLVTIIFGKATSNSHAVMPCVNRFAQHVAVRRPLYFIGRYFIGRSGNPLETPANAGNSGTLKMDLCRTNHMEFRISECFDGHWTSVRRYYTQESHNLKKGVASMQHAVCVRRNSERCAQSSPMTRRFSTAVGTVHTPCQGNQLIAGLGKPGLQ
ncbi:MAG: hypothetical protein J0M17_08785 [Planctomycetes bacterium]|nr:hypothetical protein [Planctomycetota bacterium]